MGFNHKIQTTGVFPKAENEDKHGTQLNHTTLKAGKTTSQPSRKKRTWTDLSRNTSGEAGVGRCLHWRRFKKNRVPTSC